MTFDLPPLRLVELLRKYGIRPDKRLGQVFLADANALLRVADAAEITSDAVVLEIGAGIGNLTRYLASKAAQVYAIEVDKRVIPALTDVLAGFSNVQVLQGDILQLNLENWIKQDGFLVVANIPYYITSAIMRQLLEVQIRPQRVVLTIQKEVAERICALPGEMNLLALSVQVYGQPRIIHTIPAGAFYPVPDVDSALLRVDVFSEPKIPLVYLDKFFHLAKSAFNQKRKALRNSLSGALGCKPTKTEQLLLLANVDASRRAETLSIDEWLKIIEVVS